MQLEPIGRRQGRRRQHGGLEDLGPAVDPDDGEAPAARSRPFEERHRDVRAAGPDVEHRQRVDVGRERVDRRRAQVNATEVSIDASQVAQVAGQRRQVIERTVEQLDGVGAAVHRCRVRLPRPCRPATLGAVPRAIRRLAPFAFAALLLAGTTPDAGAFAKAHFPNQSLGNRGADVDAIQALLAAHGDPIDARWDLRGDDQGGRPGIPDRQRPDRRRRRAREAPGSS